MMKRGKTKGLLGRIGIILLLSWIPLSLTFAQTVSWASIPCSARASDSSWTKHFKMSPGDGPRHIETPILLNRKELEECIGREILDYSDPHYLDDGSIGKPGIQYLFLLNEKGRMIDMCHTETGTLFDDRFEVAACLENVHYRPAKGDGIPMIYYALILVIEKKE